MNNILAIDTSTDYCSVCVLSGVDILFQGEHAPRQHAQLLMPMVEAVLSESGVNLKEMDTIAFGAGPGSFTGLRIAAGIAQGLAYGEDLPVTPVSTLAAMAHKTFCEKDAEAALVALDARMSELYWAVYRNDGTRESPEPLAILPDQVCAPGRIDLSQVTIDRLHGAGSGFEYWNSFSAECLDRVEEFEVSLVPDARAVALLARNLAAMPPEQAVPQYVRNTVTWKKLPGR